MRLLGSTIGPLKVCAPGQGARVAPGPRWTGPGVRRRLWARGPGGPSPVRKRQIRAKLVICPRLAGGQLFFWPITVTCCVRSAFHFCHPASFSERDRLSALSCPFSLPRSLAKLVTSPTLSKTPPRASEIPAILAVQASPEPRAADKSVSRAWRTPAKRLVLAARLLSLSLIALS